MLHLTTLVSERVRNVNIQYMYLYKIQKEIGRVNPNKNGYQQGKERDGMEAIL